MAPDGSTTARGVRRTREWRSLALPVALTLGVALAGTGCAGDDPAGPAASNARTSTTEAPPPTTAPGPDGTTSPSSPANENTAFAGDTRPDVSSEVVGSPVLVSVTQGEHEGYRRYVFTFRSVDPEGHQPVSTEARPRWDVRYVSAAEAVQDGSGEPVANAGSNAHLRIVFGASMHDSEGRSTLERSVSDDPPDLVFAGDFEGQVTWFYGAERERPFRVFYVSDGRVALDIAT
ncbi:MAG: hypothetical protein M3179_10755 [Actinomycetota bacterium]|nr:hypothetical protein [Actinomycetota bacterium]